MMTARAAAYWATCGNTDYLLAVIHMKMKLCYSMFSGLDILKLINFVNVSCFYNNMTILKW